MNRFEKISADYSGLPQAGSAYPTTQRTQRNIVDFTTGTSNKASNAVSGFANETKRIVQNMPTPSEVGNRFHNLGRQTRGAFKTLLSGGK